MFRDLNAANAFLTLVIACGAIGCAESSAAGDEANDDAFDEFGVLVSDGTLAGDLIEQGMRADRLVCECEPMYVTQCLGAFWPDGRALCRRDVLTARESQLRPLMECEIQVGADLLECYRGAGCIQRAIADCQLAATDVLFSCPDVDQDTRRELQACP